MFARNESKRLIRVLVSAFCVVLIAMMLSTTAFAQRYDKKTTVTFSKPVEIPGISAQVLPAGTYVIRLLDALSDRNVVQIFNKDENHLFATILAIPNYRLKATDKTVMTFAERSAGDPQAIRAWFYPGDNWGQEFVYPKKRAVELAKITNQPVLYVPEEVAPFIVAPVKTAEEPPVVALKEAPVMAVKPTGETVPVAEVVVAPPVQTARLPKTGSELPFLALLGVMSLGVAFSLRPLCDR
jgi:LPXTG-motif cell wall-anchored protein